MNWSNLFVLTVSAAIGPEAVRYILGAQGLNIHYGYTGLFNFGQAGFMAVGAWDAMAPYAQPIMERHYSKIVPGLTTPLDNLFISTMAQVYPEDRGTNYAIREGWAAAEAVSSRLRKPG